MTGRVRVRIRVRDRIKVTVRVRVSVGNIVGARGCPALAVQVLVFLT